MNRVVSWFCAPILALVLLAAAGCGDGAPAVPLPDSTLPPVDPATAGTLSVHLVKDGLGADLAQLNLSITALEVRVAGTWRPVALDQAPVAADLLTCTSATPLVLAAGVPWPQGTNDAVRFTLDRAAATVQRKDDAEPRALAVPDRFVCPMGLPGPFSVSQGRTTDLWIVFGVDWAVQALPEDSADPEAPVAALVPAQVRGLERASTGTLAGRVVAPGPAGAPPVGIPNAVVTAQLQAADGTPVAARALRTVQADAEGNFTLDLLAKGSGTTWTAVSLLVSGAPAHAGALGSPAGSLGNGPPYDTLQCRVTSPVALSTGTLGGEAAPPGPGRGAWVDLVQVFPLDAGSLASCPFVVATVPVAADGRFHFGSGLPAGIYTAVLHQFSQTAGLELAESAWETAPFALTAGADQQISF